MKKNNVKIMASLFAAALIFITGCGTNNTQNNNDNSSPSQNILTESEARQYALQKAGLETAVFTKQEYDSYDSEYEFEFHTDDKEYDCDVNALDGAITSYSVEDRKILD